MLESHGKPKIVEHEANGRIKTHWLQQYSAQREQEYTFSNVGIGNREYMCHFDELIENNFKLDAGATRLSQASQIAKILEQIQLVWHLFREGLLWLWYAVRQYNYIWLHQFSFKTD